MDKEVYKFRFLQMNKIKKYLYIHRIYGNIQFDGAVS